MNSGFDERRPELYAMFRDLVQGALARESLAVTEDVEDYVTWLLADSIRSESRLALRAADGTPVNSVFDLLPRGDVRLEAMSFDEERTVHRQIGDYLLFWSGANPEYISRLTLDDGRKVWCDYSQLGRTSYSIVGSFDHPPYDREAQTYRRLSNHFDEVVRSIARVFEALPVFRA